MLLPPNVCVVVDLLHPQLLLLILNQKSALPAMLTWFFYQKQFCWSSYLLKIRIIKISSTTRTSPVHSALFDFRKSCGPCPLYDLLKSSSLLCSRSINFPKYIPFENYHFSLATLRRIGSSYVEFIFLASLE